MDRIETPEEYQETSPGVWQTPSQAWAEAAWKDMIAAGEHGPKTQEKMLKALEEHFAAHAIAVRADERQKAAERMLVWFDNYRNERGTSGNDTYLHASLTAAIMAEPEEKLECNQ